MASLNLGDITFGLGADTSGLQKAVRELDRFVKANNRVAKSQTASAKAAVSALSKQERATREALQATLNLQASLRRAGAPSPLIAQATRNFQNLSRVMTSGRVTTLQFARSQDLFRARTGKLNRTLKNQTSNFKKGAKGGSRFNEVVRDLESASVLAVGPLSGLGARIRAIGAITSRSTLAIAAFLAGIAGVVVVAVKLSAAAVTTAIALEKVNGALEAATGFASLAARQFEFVTKLALSLGVNIESTASQFAQLSAAAKGTSLEGEGVKKAFTAVIKTGAALRLSTEQISRTLKAFTQIISKGIVQSEELRGQIGDQIPGAFIIAANAMGKTTEELNKLLKSGKVLSEDFIPKFAQELEKRFGKQAAKSTDTLAAAFGRLSASATLFSKALDASIGVSTTYKGIINSLSSLILTLASNMEGAIKVILAITGAMLGLVSVSILRGVLFLGKAILGLRAAFWALNIAMLANPVVFLSNAFVRLSLLVAGGVIGFLSFGEAVKGASKAQIQLNDDISKFLSLGEQQQGVIKQTANEFIKATDQELKSLEIRIKSTQAILNKAVEETQFRAGRGGGAALGKGNPFKNFLTRLGILPDKAKEARVALQELLSVQEDLRRQLFRLQNAPKIKTGKGAQEASKAFDTLKDKIIDLGKEVEILRGLEIKSLVTIGEAEFKVAQNIAEAQKLLKDVPIKEQNDLLGVLRAQGFAGDSVVESLAKLIAAHGDLQDFVSKTNKALKATPKAIRDANFEIEKLEVELRGLKQGPEALKKLKKEFENTRSIEQFRESLEKTVLSQDQINTVTERYVTVLKQVSEQQEEFKRATKLAADISKSFETAFDRIGSAITDAFVNGKQEALSFGNVIKGIMSEIIQSMIRISIVAPLVKAISSSVTNSITGTGTVPTGTSGTSPTVSAPISPNLAAKGIYVRSGNVQKLARGGIVSSPTLFPTSRGGSALIGEGLKDEAVLPLARLPGGDLGVQAMTGKGSGAGSSVIVNVFNNTQAEARVEKSKNSAGLEEVSIFIDQAVAKSIRSGGETFGALREVFNPNVATTGR